MVARYKKKRLAEEMSNDSPPKQLRLEGSERGRGKVEVREQLKDGEGCPFCTKPCGEEHCPYDQTGKFMDLLDEYFPDKKPID